MRIAAYQFAVSGNINENYEKISDALRAAKSNSVQLMIFPECALTGYPPRDIPRSSDVDFTLAESRCSELQKLSDENDISFIIGTICKDTGIRNRAILFRPGKPPEFYDKKALWGWDKDNFVSGSNDGVFEIDGVSVGVRICFEIRFPEYFRQLYKRKTDINIVLFYDVSDQDDISRYQLIKGHLQTRAVENVTTFISVNSIRPFQTAPTAVIGKDGQILKECQRNSEELLIYDYEKTEDSFGDRGRREYSDSFVFENENI